MMEAFLHTCKHLNNLPEDPKHLFTAAAGGKKNKEETDKSC